LDINIAENRHAKIQDVAKKEEEGDFGDPILLSLIKRLIVRDEFRG